MQKNCSESWGCTHHLPTATGAHVQMDCLCKQMPQSESGSGNSSPQHLEFVETFLSLLMSLELLLENFVANFSSGYESV